MGRTGGRAYCGYPPEDIVLRLTVTGASGFIGSHLVPALLNSGHEVGCMVEPRMEKPIPVSKVFETDISTGAEITEAFSGADAVVHLAARNHVLQEKTKDPLAEYRKVNVEGTRNVIRAAADSGVKWFIHLGSVKAMGEESENVLAEVSPCVPKTPYGISKLESEEVVRAELIEGAIGEGSLFHDTFGYYANGVGYDTAVLPKGWEKRLVPVRSADTGDNIRKVTITPLPTTWTAASGEPTARRKSSSSAFRA